MKVKEEVNLKLGNIEYTLRISPRAKKLRLTVFPGGKLVVTAPARMEMKRIEHWLVEKSTWILRAQAKAKNYSPADLLPEHPGDYQKNKGQVLQYLTERLDHYNRHYGFTWQRIRVGRQKTRWGSCSKQGTLSFSYHIIQLPPEQADYIVVHELCHLKEFNHSPKFWVLVSQTIPDYKTIRQVLKKYRLRFS